jgi:hypothetical protein
MNFIVDDNIQRCWAFTYITFLIAMNKCQKLIEYNDFIFRSSTLHWQQETNLLNFIRHTKMISMWLLVAWEYKTTINHFLSLQSMRSRPYKQNFILNYFHVIPMKIYEHVQFSF